MRTRSWLVVTVFTGALMACGQKGPLLLPDAQHPHKKINAPKPPAPTAPTPPTDAPAGGEPKISPAPPQ